MSAYGRMSPIYYLKANDGKETLTLSLVYQGIINIYILLKFAD